MTLVLAIGALWARSEMSGPPAQTSGTVGPVAPIDGGVSGLLPAPAGSAARAAWPPAPADARSTPLGYPAAPPTGSTSYAFEDRIAGGASNPVRFDPCRPIHVVVNSTMAPASGDAILREAMDVVSKATGLQFVVEGSTDEAPSSSRPPVLGRYGNRWAPVLVAWTDEMTVPRLSGHTVGLGGPSGAPYSSDADKHWVSGIVYLDTPDLVRAMSQPNGRAIARSIVMHEFGHLVGLDHVDDPSQIMYPSTTDEVAFGPGDLEGLRRLGNGPCFS